MTSHALHRAAARLPAWAYGLLLGLTILFFTAALAVNATATPLPHRVIVTRTVPGPTVPGPTTTVSYLLEVTVTPGRNGY